MSHMQFVHGASYPALHVLLYMQVRMWMWDVEMHCFCVHWAEQNRRLVVVVAVVVWCVVYAS